MMKLDLQLLTPHRYWLVLLMMAMALFVISPPILRSFEEPAAKNLAQIKNQRTQTEQALNQLRDDVAAAQKLKNEMTLAEAEQSLAPVDRLQAATLLESAADDAHLHGFSYIFAPEQKVQKGGPVSEPQELSLSTITLHGDAPSDEDVYGFADSMRGVLPGRMRLQQFSVERTTKTESPIAMYNVRFNATFEWLSNGAAKDMAGGM